MKRSALFLVLSLVFLEWLDFSLYLYLAKAVFATEFFKASIHSLMFTFALFAAAYIARPIGGWLFGRQADLTGRRKPMVFSAALMGLATVGICLLPGYAVIGIWAPWCLLLFRMAQGLALGGEINTSAMFLVEHHPHNPLVAGSFIAASGAMGMFVGGMIASVVQSHSAPWFWRVVFGVVGVLSLWVCRKRKQLQESPEFSQIAPSASGRFVFQHHWRGIRNIAAAGAFVSVTVYLCNVFWVSFASDKQLWSGATCAWMGSLAQCSSAFLALPIARFTKPKWTSHLMQASMLTAALAGPFLFYFTAYGSAQGVMVFLLGYVLANAFLCSSLFYFLYLQFPAQYRCRGVSTIYAIAATIGALSLPVAEQLVTSLHWDWFPGLLVSLVAITALMVIRYSPIHANSSVARDLPDLAPE